MDARLTDTPEQRAERLAWWREARFGMFIHWGVYAVPGRGEWVQWNEQISVGEYARLADEFRAERFDATAWAEVAKAAGMKYTVLTARHHDGYSLWDSAASWGDFTSAKTGARRDFVAEYTRAARAAGLRVGLYYSPLDWRFPGYFLPNLYRESAEAMKRQTYDQVRELLTGYGPIDLLWWDGGSDDWLGFGGLEKGPDGWRSRDTAWPQTRHFPGPPLWEGDRLNAMARELQPHIILNDRAGSPGVEWPGDYTTPECRIGEFNLERPWETCDVLAGGWGYQPGKPPRSLHDCLHLLARVVGGDGNLLLNVGPRPDGRIEDDQVARLREIGDWLAVRGESIYGTRGGPFAPTEHWTTTRRDRTVYVHILNWPKQGGVSLPALPAKVVSSRLLGADGAATVCQTAAGLTIDVPPALRHEADTVVALDLDSCALEIAPRPA